MTQYNDNSSISNSINDLQRQINDLRTQPRLISSSIDRGGTQSSDYDGNGISSPGTRGWFIGTDEYTGIGYIHLNGRIIPTPAPYTLLPLVNSWVDYSGGVLWHRGAYAKTAENIVCLSGMISSGTVGATIATLPEGYRPDHPILWPILTNTTVARLDISPTGTITLASGSTNGWISLSGIMFPAADPSRVWTNVALDAGWGDYNAINPIYPICSYWRDSLGRIWLRGLARQLSPGVLVADSKMLAVPFNKRDTSHYPTLANSTYGTVDIRPVGATAEIYAKTGSNTTWVSLSPLTFPDAAIADNWKINSAYLNSWQRYSVGFPPSRYLPFSDGIVMKDGLTGTGTISNAAAGIAQGVPDGLGPDLIPWVNDSMGGSEMFLVASTLAAGRLDAQVSINPTDAAGATKAWIHATGSSTWYSYGGVNYLQGS